MSRAARRVTCAIFDLDGTLVDSMPMWRTVANTYLVNNGRTPEEHLWDKVKRLTEPETAEYFIARYGIEKPVARICAEIEDLIFGAYSESVQLKEGAREFLEALRGRVISIALATATDRKCVDVCLRRLGIGHFFRAVHTCIDLNTSKHKPLIFERCASDCGASAAESAVFEDALHCVRTAKAAGFTVFALHDGSGDEVTEPPLSDWQRIEKIADVCARNFGEILKDARFRSIMEP